MRYLIHALCLLGLWTGAACAQNAPYDNPPGADPPYYRVRYEASSEPGKLIYPVAYTIWVPPQVAQLRGVIVHQHGCGEGSCKSGQTGAFDLHWQALARKHDCALLSPAYEQPEGADCQMWCDPRNGSDDAFQQALKDLGEQTGHPELSQVPWALWGHSGGGHWAGGMVLLHPDRVAAAWLRSGVPLLEKVEGRNINPHKLPKEAADVPVMCNLGTKEGFSEPNGRFSGVWPANQTFFLALRGAGGKVGIAVDPLTSHECGNQRYLAIRWLDSCLQARLPESNGQALRSVNTEEAWLAPLPEPGKTPQPARKVSEYDGDRAHALWLPNEAIAKAWIEYVTDTKIADTSPPPAPSNVRLEGNRLRWDAQADLESGVSHFIIRRAGRPDVKVPEQPKNPFGRPLFQGLQYSDTPVVPLVQAEYEIDGADVGQASDYQVITVNTVGLESN